MAKVTPERWAEARERVKGGASISEVAAWLGISKQAVSKRAKGEGWVDAPPPSTSAKVDASTKVDPVNEAPTGEGLTDQQRLFVAEYLVDRNATKAAIRAGYSSASARELGPRLLKKVAVRAAVDAGLNAVIADRRDLAHRTINEIGAIAFARIDRIAKWGKEGLTYCSSEGIEDETLAAIAEVSETPGPYGNKLRIKMHDKLGALKWLAEHLVNKDQSIEEQILDDPDALDDDLGDEDD